MADYISDHHPSRNIHGLFCGISAELMNFLQLPAGNCGQLFLFLIGISCIGVHAHRV
jgi:hypothetical protein